MREEETVSLGWYREELITLEKKEKLKRRIENCKQSKKVKGEVGNGIPTALNVSLHPIHDGHNAQANTSSLATFKVFSSTV